MNPHRIKEILKQALALMAVALMVLTSFPLYDAGTVLAFKPTESWKGTPNDITHVAITEQAIKELIEQENFIPGINKITPSMQKAIQQIKDGNSETDLSSTYFVDEAHFTGETFDGSRSRLISNRNNMIASVRGVSRRKSPEAARSYLGAATHAIQDFYAHTNWVEMGNSSPYGNLGHVELGTEFNPGFVAAKNEATCNPCDKCRNCDNNVIRAKLTSSYFGAYPWSKKPVNKCSHGAKTRTATVPNLIFPYIPPIVTVEIHPDTTENDPAKGGIAKDSLDCQDSPHSNWHYNAARVALAATKAYLVYVFKQASLKPTPKEQKIIFGVDDALAFAVDTTGSMGGAIAGVRDRLTEIVNSRRGTELEPARYVLAPFNDPGVGPLTDTEDADEFIGAINSLQADGGDDCPELAQSGNMLALSAMDGGGELMMITDATAKDDGLAGSVRAVAESKDVKVTTIALGSCSPIDPEYYRTASETGGQVFVLSPSETSNITKLVDFIVRPDTVEMLSVTDTLAGASKTYSVPVDSTLTRATFSVSGTTGLVLKRPDGSTVQTTDAGVETVPLSNGALFSIVNPAPGAWTMTVNGSGPLSVRVSGESLLHLASFNFVDFVNNPGHEGFAPITGMPLVNQPAMVSAEISAASVQTASFELRGEDGTTFQTLNLDEIPLPTGAPTEFSSPLTKKFFGQLTVPNRSFLVYAVGTDSNGQSYQRLLPGTIKPRSVKIITQPIGDLHPGQSASYSFQVQNFGTAGVFQISIGDDQNYVQNISQHFLRLEPNESKSVTVQLQPPANAPVGILDTLTLSAQSLASPEANNSAVVKARVAEASPVQLGDVDVTPLTGNGDNVLDPGEAASLSVHLKNDGGLNATNVSAMLVTLTPGVDITAGQTDYPDIAPSQSAINSAPLSIKLPDDLACGASVNFLLLVRHDGYDGPVVYNFTLQTGSASAATGNTSVVSYNGPPVPIQDADPTGVDVPLSVSGLNGVLNDLNFRFDGIDCTTAAGATTVGLDHTYVSDLVVKLTSPRGTTVTLINHAGSGGNNFCNTLLDDESNGPLIDATSSSDAPFTGSFRPSNLLSAFQGEDPNGTWILHVSDEVGADIGSVRAFSLVVTSGTINSADCRATSTSAADLSLSNVATPNPALTGSSVTYTTRLTNNGPSTAQSVRVTYDLPQTLAFVSCAATNGGNCGVSGGNHMVMFDSIPAGATATITIIATADCALPDATVINSAASVTSSTPDANSNNNSSTASLTLNNPSPAITGASVDKPQLWPPNHKMVDVTVNYSVDDNCGPINSSLKVASDEPPNGPGDGNTSADWKVLDAHHVQLRAERAGGGNGRTYTITITATDSAGNSSNQNVTVKVPKS
jgi:uncharacterized repeat protein (TIGR01451 family)